MSPLQQALVFLLELAFSIFIIALILRFLLQLFRADFRNQVCQLITKFTNPLVIPLRRVIPGFFKIDFATLVAIVILSFIKVYLMFLLQGYTLTFSLSLVLYVLGDILESTINIAIIAIIAQAVMSWFSPSPYHPGVQFVSSLANPINSPARKIIPPMGGLDLSPMLTIIGLYLLQILIADPLMGRSSY